MDDTCSLSEVMEGVDAGLCAPISPFFVLEKLTTNPEHSSN